MVNFLVFVLRHLVGDMGMVVSLLFLFKSLVCTPRGVIPLCIVIEAC